jgi:hypothetical protein
MAVIKNNYMVLTLNISFPSLKILITPEVETVIAIAFVVLLTDAAARCRPPKPPCK